MSSRVIRIRKEARTLLWPWCAVTISGLLPSEASAIGFVVGIPLLTVLSFGNEFQHGTLSLLLTQPEDRRKIWIEKWTVTLVAVLSAVLVFCFSWRHLLRVNPGFWVVPAGLVLIMTVGSGAFWTLVARSTIGGLALNLCAQLAVAVVWELLTIKLLGSTADTTALDASAAMGYAGLMTWLGRRELIRFKITGKMESQDLLTAGPAMMPEALARLFRCHPRGPTFNLIRKELRLLRPLWLITVLFVLGWACLMIASWFTPQIDNKPLGSILAVILLAVHVPLTLVLAGGLPLGEERTLGVQAWHSTLPISSRHQWLIKLVIAILAGLVCAVVVPLTMIAAGRLFLGSSLGIQVLLELSSPSASLAPNPIANLLLLLLVLCLSSFWCSCASGNTGTAAVWVLPVLGALAFAAGSGEWVFEHALWETSRSPLGIAWMIVPILVLGMIQSYWLFRSEPRGMFLHMARCLLPLAAATFICSLALEAVGAWRSLPSLLALF